MPWFLLLLIMPRSATGAVLFYLVLMSVGIVLLHWCLTWFGWTISFRAAAAARAAPGLVAAVLAGLVGFQASLPVVMILGLIELLLGVVVVSATAVRLVGSAYGTGFEEGELLFPLTTLWDDGEDDTELQYRYGQSASSLVRAARSARLT